VNRASPRPPRRRTGGPRPWGRAASALLALFTAVCGLSGCARSPASPGPAQQAGPLVLPVAADPDAAARAIAERARDADVLYLGEQHDNPAHHAHQRQVLQALVAAGLRPVVAFEMLDENQQGVLSRALADAPSAEEVERRLGWRARGWPDFAMYWPLFDLAARERLEVVALDLPPADARRVARDGLASLGTRAAGLTSLLAADPEREAAIARAIRDGHCGLLPEARVPRMVEAWHARNVTMARHLAAALQRGRPVVAIVGRGHQEAGGLPDQLEQLRPGTRQLIVSLVEAPPGQPPAAAPDNAGADVVWLTPPVAREDPCAPLRRGGAAPR
jgi:uncharacterized iron-regulated protein